MNEGTNIAMELSARIDAEVRHFDGVMPEKTAIAWRGYLAAMLEWNLVSLQEYESLLARIPKVENDPALDILRGRD